MNHIWTRINAQQPQPEPTPASKWLEFLCAAHNALSELDTFCADNNIPADWLTTAMTRIDQEITLAEAGTGTDGDQ